MKLQPIFLTPTKRDEQDLKALLGLTPGRQWMIMSDTKAAILSDRDGVSVKKGGRWKTVTTASHRATIELYARVERRRRTLAVYRLGKKKTKSVPGGYALHIGDYAHPNLVLIRQSDGMDYHPDPKEIRNLDFKSMIEKLQVNCELRKKQEDAMERSKVMRAAFESNINTTIVLLEDSRRAGNCVEGSLAFAERRLGISREDILNGQHLFGVPASRLLETEDSNARRAAFAAFERETTVSI